MDVMYWRKFLEYYFLNQDKGRRKLNYFWIDSNFLVELPTGTNERVYCNRKGF